MTELDRKENYQETDTPDIVDPTPPTTPTAAQTLLTRSLYPFWCGMSRFRFSSYHPKAEPTASVATTASTRKSTTPAPILPFLETSAAILSASYVHVGRAGRPSAHTHTTWRVCFQGGKCSVPLAFYSMVG